jgi:uncharacterized surface protein with fasciclin (FAS1) repeats
MKKTLIAAVLALAAAFTVQAKVTATDIVADNGVIHVIDTVIIPK